MHAHWAQNRKKISADELNEQGVLYENLTHSSNPQDVIDRLKTANGYVHQDEVALHPHTPGLSEMCAKFIKEHLHDEDEVRYVLEGEGVFDIRSKDDRWMIITVEKGDLIVVPKDRYHRFALTDSRTIRCVRLFQDPKGWEPKYRTHQQRVDSIANANPHSTYEPAPRYESAPR